MHIRIKIIGANCSNGMKLSKMAERATDEIEEEVTIEKINDEKQKNRYGVRNIPALIIDDEIVSEGKVLTVREIKKLLA